MPGAVLRAHVTQSVGSGDPISYGRRIIPRESSDLARSMSPRALSIAPRTSGEGGLPASATSTRSPATSTFETVCAAKVDPRTTSESATGRGNVDVDRGRWDKARSWEERALERLGEPGDPRRERWQVMQNPAIVHRCTGDLEGARHLLERAREEGDRLQDPDAAVEVENGVGQLPLSLGDARGAEPHFLKALRAARTPTARVTIGVNLGEALLRQGRSPETGESAGQAEALAGSVSGKLPEVYRLLAQVAQVAQERAEGEAFIFLKQAFSLIRERELTSYEKALTREAYGDLRVAQGDLDRGLPQLRTAAEIYRRIGMGETATRLLETVLRHGGEV